MPFGVSLANTGCTANPGGAALIVTTLDIPVQGVTMFGVGASIGPASGTGVVRQDIYFSLPSPVYVNETGIRQSIVLTTYVNETG